MRSRISRSVRVAMAIATMAVRSMNETLFEATVGGDEVCFSRK